MRIGVSYNRETVSPRVLDDLFGTLKTYPLIEINEIYWDEFLPPGENIDQFQRELCQSDVLIPIVNEHYLKSPNCIFELVHYIQNKGHQKKIIPIALDDFCYNEERQKAIISYWDSCYDPTTGDYIGRSWLCHPNERDNIIRDLNRALQELRSLKALRTADLTLGRLGALSQEVKRHFDIPESFSTTADHIGIDSARDTEGLFDHFEEKTRQNPMCIQAKRNFASACRHIGFYRRVRNAIGEIPEGYRTPQENHILIDSIARLSNTSDELIRDLTNNFTSYNELSTDRMKILREATIACIHLCNFEQAFILCNTLRQWEDDGYRSNCVCPTTSRLLEALLLLMQGETSRSFYILSEWIPFSQTGSFPDIMRNKGDQFRMASICAHISELNEAEESAHQYWAHADQHFSTHADCPEARTPFGPWSDFLNSVYRSLRANHEVQKAYNIMRYLHSMDLHYHHTSDGNPPLTSSIHCLSCLIQMRELDNVREWIDHANQIILSCETPSPALCGIIKEMERQQLNKGD